MPVPSKVTYNGNTLIDLTDDSVTPQTLAFGVTAHSASGNQITGTAYKNTYYVAGTQSQSTNSWTGTISEVSALYNGLTIDYWLPYASSGNVTLNLTLPDNTTTGAVNVYAYGTTRMSTQVEANNIVRLVYQTVTIDNTSYTGWWGSKPYPEYSTSDSGLLSITNASVFSGAIKYRKIGKLVEINAHQITLVSSVSSGNYVELGTMPSGFRPQSGVYPASVPGSTRQVGTGFNLTAYNSGSGYVNPFVVEIDPNGLIVLYATQNTVHTTDSINISMMYFTD